MTDLLVLYNKELSDKISSETDGTSPSTGLTKSSLPRPSDSTNTGLEVGKPSSSISQGGFTSQFRGIFLKNYALQAKQRGTNLCQILTPIICLLFTLFVKELTLSKLKNFSLDISIPFLYNIPYESIYGKHSLLTRSNEPYISFDSCYQSYLYDFKDESEETKSFVGDSREGLMSKTRLPFGIKYYECEGYGVMPAFQKPVNGTINNQLYENLKYMSSINYHTVPDIHLIPDGAFTFYEANSNNLTYKLQVDDVHDGGLHRANGVTKFYLNITDEQSTTVVNVYDGQMIMVDMISRSFLRHINNNALLISGSQPMPMTNAVRGWLETALGLAALSFYPIGLSLLLPVFLYSLVHEKEERLRQIMKMSGMKMNAYWIANYLWFFFLTTITLATFFLVGRFGLGTNFFTDTSFWVLASVLVGWGLSQISLAILFQNLFSKAKTAIIAGYLLSIWTTLLAATFCVAIYNSPRVIPLHVKLYPPVAFVRLIYYLASRCSNLDCVASFSEFNDEMWSCLMILYGGAFVLLFLGIYLDEILPQEYGLAKHPLYFIKDLFKSKSCSIISSSDTQDSYNAQETYIGIEENIEGPKAELAKSLITDDDDDDVQKERMYVNSIQAPYTSCPLVIKNLRKVYPAAGRQASKVAIKDLSLHVRKGEMFGLLGPNGAGKTSLISILTGLYPPESGNAWVGGYDILDQIDMVHTQVGVCPQFDLLWPDLTIEEHLLFYARIRGLPKKEEKAVAEKAMAEVYLTKLASFKTKQLSGGMKRRLSVAIALVGDPKIIFLDEPTTGLDIENRRQLWDILAEIRSNKAIVLTTHSMDEADVLCTKIGIMSNGVLRCIGPQARLKSKYGGGYHLYVNCHKNAYLNSHPERKQNSNNSVLSEDDYDQVRDYIEELIPVAELKSSFNGNFIFFVSLEGFEISKIFEQLESRKEEFAIADWGISQSTLEDVFMEIVKDSEDGLWNKVQKVMTSFEFQQSSARGRHANSNAMSTPSYCQRRMSLL